MDFVDDHAREPGKDARRILVGGQQRQAFGRGQQDMRRVGALAQALAMRRVAGAVLDADGSPISSTGLRRLRRISAASAFSGET
jgi:hypothetical protein